MRTGYATWGCMWEKGLCTKEAAYRLRSGKEENIPMQSRITAWWPDGTVKWTAHTADAGKLEEDIEVVLKGEGTKEADPGAEDGTLKILDFNGALEIRAGAVCIAVSRDGRHLFDAAYFHGRKYLTEAAPALILEEPSVLNGNQVKTEKRYEAVVEEISLEEEGPLEATVKYTGCHESADGERKLPFIIRMKIGFDSPRLDFTHTFLYDGDEEKDFLKGIGVCFRPRWKEGFTTVM